MLSPIAAENVSKTTPECFVLPTLDTATVNVWRVLVPLIARMAHAEPVGIAERRGQVDIRERARGLDVVQLV